jgi:hypothetical protein
MICDHIFRCKMMLMLPVDVKCDHGLLISCDVSDSGSKLPI